MNWFSPSAAYKEMRYRVYVRVHMRCMVLCVGGRARNFLSRAFQSRAPCPVMFRSSTLSGFYHELGAIRSGPPLRFCPSSLAPKWRQIRCRLGSPCRTRRITRRFPRGPPCPGSIWSPEKPRSNCTSQLPSWPYSSHRWWRARRPLSTVWDQSQGWKPRRIPRTRAAGSRRRSRGHESSGMMRTELKIARSHGNVETSKCQLINRYAGKFERWEL